MLIPPLRNAHELALIADRLDGLIISGGDDVNPARYGQAPHKATTLWNDARDESEIALLDAADDRALPVLGICRGMQLMAVRAGGRLIQHLPDVIGEDSHLPRPGSYASIAIRTVPGTQLSELLGPEILGRCHHHQATTEAPGFTSCAVATDGTLEGIEKPGGPFQVGVQWHPETDADHRIFRALVEAAVQSRGVTVEPRRVAPV